MTAILVGGFGRRRARNGVAARRWVAAQTYDVERAARDITTPVPVLADIAQNGTTRLIEMVASNKSTPDAVLAAITRNMPNLEICFRVCRNKNASAATIAAAQAAMR